MARVATNYVKPAGPVGRGAVFFCYPFDDRSVEERERAVGHAREASRKHGQGGRIAFWREPLAGYPPDARCVGHAPKKTDEGVWACANCGQLTFDEPRRALAGENDDG